MKKLYLNTGNMNTIFNDLKDSLDGSLTLESSQYKLKIRSKNADGIIRGITVSPHISFVEFDLVFYKDIQLSLESDGGSNVLFVYCSKGNFGHSFGISGKRKTVKEDHNSIIRNASNINSIFYFEGFKPVRFSILSYNTKAENEGLFSAINKVFSSNTGNYKRIGRQNFKIAKKINEFNTIPQKGIVRNLLRNRILEEILDIELDQHTYGYLKDIQPIMTLANKQLEELRKVSRLNFSMLLSEAGQTERNYLLKMFREKYHLVFNRLYNQKLVS
ncbi:hypothetical protein [Flavobacterium ajazii]|uniref:hypothetical protein n=1 Tax=Flavobacterium ajazii TaxID=2692318 RepID=UPI0013D8D44A|nr:hypothetical protein [Flavobacterium ajazii]